MIIKNRRCEWDVVLGDETYRWIALAKSDIAKTRESGGSHCVIFICGGLIRADCAFGAF